MCIIFYTNNTSNISAQTCCIAIHKIHPISTADLHVLGHLPQKILLDLFQREVPIVALK
jgi:hypothetical protein